METNQVISKIRVPINGVMTTFNLKDEVSEHGSNYTEGAGISITDNIIALKYSAGEGISFADNKISVNLPWAQDYTF